MRELTNSELEAVSGGFSLLELVIETAINGGGRELRGFLKKWPLQN
jgi:bacteriocin-like protein